MNVDLNKMTSLDDAYRTPAVRREFERECGYSPLGVGEEIERAALLAGTTETYREAFAEWRARDGKEEKCVVCDAMGTVRETMEEGKHPYGDTGQVFTAMEPVLRCTACNFAWTDFRGEIVRDAACKLANDLDPVRWSGQWYPIDKAPRDGTKLRVRYDENVEEDGVYYAEERYCMLGAPQGSYGPGWVSTEAGNLPVDEPFEWCPAKVLTR